MPVKEIVMRFLRYAERFSPHTRRRYRDALWKFAAEMPLNIEDICPEHIENWISSQKQLCNSSKNAYLTAIRSLFSFAKSYYDITNIMLSVKAYQNNEPKQRVISEIEYRKILQIAKPKERAVIRFLANTGLRATEFAELTSQCISPDQKYLTCIGKGQRRRIVPLNNTSRESLNLIFSKSYTRDSLYNMCRRLSRQAQIPNFGPHAFRHRFCTQLAKHVPTSLAIKITGHSSSVVFEKVYVHLSAPADVVGVTDCLDF